jgi:hypothetical protein
MALYFGRGPSGWRYREAWAEADQPLRKRPEAAPRGFAAALLLSPYTGRMARIFRMRGITCNFQQPATKLLQRTGLSAFAKSTL